MDKECYIIVGRLLSLAETKKINLSQDRKLFDKIGDDEAAVLVPKKIIDEMRK